MTAARSSHRTAAPTLLLMPGLVLVLIFLAWPILHGVWLSLHHFDGLKTTGSVSLDAYRGVLTDPVMYAALGHTTAFAAITVIGKNAVGLGLAALVHSKLRGARQLQLLLFLPVTLNIVVVGAFWSLFLSSARFGGLLNGALDGLGLGTLSRSWLSEPGIALVTVAFVEIWRWAGLHMLLFLAGLQSIEPSLYEAARLDGAGRWSQFRFVTLPALAPIIAASSTLAFIGAFVRSFDVVWVLTRAGYGTDVMGTYIYREAFSFGRFDRATAAGLLLAMLLALIFLLARYTGSRRSPS